MDELHLYKREDENECGLPSEQVPYGGSALIGGWGEKVYIRHCLQLTLVVFPPFDGTAGLRLIWAVRPTNCFTARACCLAAPRRLVLPPAILPPRTLCREGTLASLHWAVGCRLASVGRVAPAGILHGVVAPPNTVGTDFLEYWTHCCFGSVPLSGLSLFALALSLSLTPLRSGDGAET
ncbi:hypothetical protein D4764_12G0010630 [Takifugu flavidus]|uniref:Uncharacterized protein n=1 Tax=Takifugu flavidus TaxID=433684 RepID=A0A5C6PDW0_9TELE|nr:hypothetical protein D4764_12G0010630 [Takifugu flavidus]